MVNIGGPVAGFKEIWISCLCIRRWGKSVEKWHKVQCDNCIVYDIASWQSELMLKE